MLFRSKVLDAMPATRGFDKTKLVNDVPNSLPGGVTNMAEGLYRGWDELRTVAPNQQSGIRVIVLFTDGSANTVPGLFDASGVAKGLFVSDFPKRTPDPDGITTNNPSIQGLYQTETGAQNPSVSTTVAWNSTTVLSSVKWLPATTTQDHHRSAGIPTTFPLFTNALKVDGVPQSNVRGLRNFNAAQGKYPAEAWNIRNAATKAAAKRLGYRRVARHSWLHLRPYLVYKPAHKIRHHVPFVNVEEFDSRINVEVHGTRDRHIPFRISNYKKFRVDLAKPNFVTCEIFIEQSHLVVVASSQRSVSEDAHTQDVATLP